MADSHEECPVVALYKRATQASQTTAFFNLQGLISQMGAAFWLASHAQEISKHFIQTLQMMVLMWNPT